MKANIVYIAQSLDGYIADKNGGLDWLHSVPNPNNDDGGFGDFMNRIDGLIMGRTTFETVCSFDIDWPYTKPVFVLSNTLKEIPNTHKKHASLINGNLKTIIENLNNKGFNELYIDGGTTIQSFLKEDLIDEMIITTIPVLLGGGSSLFGDLAQPLNFELIQSKTVMGSINQCYYKRKKQ